MSFILSDTASAYPLRCRGRWFSAARMRAAARAIRKEFMIRSIGLSVQATTVIPCQAQPTLSSSRDYNPWLDPKWIGFFAQPFTTWKSFIRFTSRCEGHYKEILFYSLLYSSSRHGLSRVKNAGHNRRSRFDDWLSEIPQARVTLRTQAILMLCMNGSGNASLTRTPTRPKWANGIK